MKKRHIFRNNFLIVGVMLLFNGCNGPVLQDEEPISETEATSVSIPETTEPTIETVEEINLSAQAYESQTGAFRIRLPGGWNCSESGAYQVNCQSPGMEAEIQVRATSTEYELLPDAFESFVHAEMVHRFSEKKEYIEIDTRRNEDSIALNATWREGEIYKEGTDTFIRNGKGVFHVALVSDQNQLDIFSDILSQSAESLEMNPGGLQEDAFYVFRREYSAPDVFFKIEVPTGWGRFADAGSIERTVVEGFLSPDGHASAQAAVYRQGTPIAQSVKAEKTLEIMRDLYGFDLRISHDKALPDGRERLAWSAERKGITGISYFDSYGSSLYVFSILWEEPTEAIYLPILEEIEASFSRE